MLRPRVQRGSGLIRRVDVLQRLIAFVLTLVALAGHTFGDVAPGAQAEAERSIFAATSWI